MVRLGLSGRLPGGVIERTECAACTAPSTHFVQITGAGPAQRIEVCARHESIARADADRFMRHVRSKDQFIDDPDVLKREARRRRELNP